MLKGLAGERGISVILETVLVIGIFIAAFTIIYSIYSRTGLREAEAEHMEAVRDSLLEIKELVGENFQGESRSVELQMSVPGGMAGTLSVSPAKDNKYGYLEFRARNTWLPSRSFFLEGGAMIENEGGRVYMSSAPGLVTVSDVEEENRIQWVRVIVHYVLIENFEFMAASMGPRTVEITCVSDNYTVSPENDRPNRENVVVNLEGRVEDRNREAWKKFLEDLKETLPVYYNVTLDPVELKLTIEGFYPAMKDILYYERLTWIRIRV